MSRWQFWSKFFSRHATDRVRRRKLSGSAPRQANRTLFAEPLESRLCLSAVSNYLWATDLGDDTVSKIDKATNAVVATISAGIPHYPFSVAVDEDSVWVGGIDSQPTHVARINKTTDTVIATIPLPTPSSAPYPDAARSIAVDLDSVWVATYGGGELVQIDKETNSIVATTEIGSEADAVAVDRDFAWVTTSVGTVVKVNKNSHAIVDTINVGGGSDSSLGIAIDASSVWVAASHAGALVRIDKATDTVTTSIALGVGTFPSAVAVDANFAWVSNEYDTVSNVGNLVKIDKATNAIVDTIHVASGISGGPYFSGVALDSDSVWTDGYYQSARYRINKSTDQVVATTPLGLYPQTFGDFTGYAYDALFGSKTTVIASDAVYDGNPHGGMASVSGAGGLNESLPVTYVGISGTIYGPSLTAPTDAGAYSASAAYAGDLNHFASSGSAQFRILPKELDAIGSTENSINISKAGTLSFVVSSVTGIVAGDGSVYDLFNGATFWLRVGGGNGTLYSVSSTATVLANGSVQISWRMSEELYNDLYGALGGATPSDKTLVNLFVSGTSNDGNYEITEDVFARIFHSGKVVFS